VLDQEGAQILQSAERRRKLGEPVPREIQVLEILKKVPRVRHFGDAIPPQQQLRQLGEVA